jgi:hypothetical protein
MNDKTATEQTDTTTETTTETTTLPLVIAELPPCPSWCDSPPNEGFDIEIATGQPMRTHEHVVERGDGFTVWITAKERITATGPVLEPVLIGCDAAGFDGLSELTPARARDLAAVLVRAADEAAWIEAQR